MLTESRWGDFLSGALVASALFTAFAFHSQAETDAAAEANRHELANAVALGREEGRASCPKVAAETCMSFWYGGTDPKALSMARRNFCKEVK